MMERASILVGKCYRDSEGIVYEVTSYDAHQVQFLARAETDSVILTGERGSESWQSFLHKLQGEVPCPQ